jgi:hypothetical protein
MARKWTIYHGGPNRGARMLLRITLNSRGVPFFNKRAYEAIGSPAAAEMMFDEHENVIGQRPRDLRFQNAFPFKARSHDREKKYNYRIVHTAPFCKHFDIRPKSTILFTNPDLDRDDALLLDLNTAVNVGRGSR